MDKDTGAVGVCPGAGWGVNQEKGDTYNTLKNDKEILPKIRNIQQIKC